MIALLLACSEPKPLLHARVVASGVEITSSVALHRVEIQHEGAPLSATILAQPALMAMVPLPERTGRATALAVTADGTELVTTLELPPSGQISVLVGNEVLSPNLRRAAGETTVTVRCPGQANAELTVGPQRTPFLARPGVPWTETFELPQGKTSISARCGDAVLTGEVDAVVLNEDTVSIELASVFPADPSGHAEITRQADSVVLPSAAARGALAALGVVTVRDDQAPWSHVGVLATNHTDLPLEAIVSASVAHDGVPDPTFRPRLRAQENLTKVSVQARLAPHETTRLALPIYVDRTSAVPGLRTLAVSASLPQGRALATTTREVSVQLGGGWLSAAFALGVITSALGWLMLAWFGPGWVRAARTSDLVRISLFAAVSFVVAGAFQVVGYAVAAMLGPFAPFLIGIVDDAVRVTLLGSLIVLLPRPGTLSLAIAVGWVLRALTLGSVHPVDFLYLGSAMALTEGALYLAGPSRGLSSFPRLALGFSLANASAMALGLVTSAVLYRLYFASWYVIALLIFPGTLYVILGAWFASRTARALQQVSA